ncbi:MAG: phosphoglycerate kinase [Bacteroidales bacterium]|nr:phosphoglycerate kinase [Bacteroidales bacterium]
MQKFIDTYDFKGKRVIARVDFNVPLDKNFNVTDDTRIRAAVPTIKKVLEGGGSIILMSHLGRPKGVDKKYSLEHIIYKVEELLGRKIQFCPDCMQADEAAKNLKPGEVLLLENLRFYAEEEGKPRGLSDDASDDEKKAAKAKVKESQKEFTKHLASYADCYINDAFGTAHRAHASTALIAEYFPEDKMFGYIMEGEIKAIDKVVNNPQHPVTAIIGGSKVSSKIGILQNLVEKVDNLVIGGGMAFTFVKAKGGKIGESICEDDQIQVALDILAAAEKKGTKVYIPKYAVAANRFDNDATKMIVKIDEIPDGWMGMDAGTDFLVEVEDVIMNSKTVLWNGPVGVFEMPRFAEGTLYIAKALAKATQEKGVFTLVGGGDSVAAVNQMGYADKVSYVSTGGGAMLESLEGKLLPGIKAIVE